MTDWKEINTGNQRFKMESILVGGLGYFNLIL
jgi:hypothetical protein